MWYDNWLIRARWPAYEYLLLSYDPVAASKFESFWKKGESYEDNAKWNNVNITKDGDQQSFTLATGITPPEGECKVTAYEVEVDYTIPGWQRLLPLLGSSARHLALIDDRLAVPLTFNPNEKTVRFPVFCWRVVTPASRSKRSFHLGWEHPLMSRLTDTLVTAANYRSGSVHRDLTGVLRSCDYLPQEYHRAC